MPVFFEFRKHIIMIPKFFQSDVFKQYSCLLMILAISASMYVGTKWLKNYFRQKNIDVIHSNSVIPLRQHSEIPLFMPIYSFEYQRYVNYKFTFTSSYSSPVVQFLKRNQSLGSSDLLSKYDYSSIYRLAYNLFLLGRYSDEYEVLSFWGNIIYNFSHRADGKIDTEINKLISLYDKDISFHKKGFIKHLSSQYIIPAYKCIDSGLFGYAAWLTRRAYNLHQLIDTYHTRDYKYEDDILLLRALLYNPSIPLQYPESTKMFVKIIQDGVHQYFFPYRADRILDKPVDSQKVNHSSQKNEKLSFYEALKSSPDERMILQQERKQKLQKIKQEIKQRLIESMPHSYFEHFGHYFMGMLFFHEDEYLKAWEHFNIISSNGDNLILRELSFLMQGRCLFWGKWQISEFNSESINNIIKSIKHKKYGETRRYSKITQKDILELMQYYITQMTSKSLIEDMQSYIDDLRFR